MFKEDLLATAAADRVPAAGEATWLLACVSKSITLLFLAGFCNFKGSSLALAASLSSCQAKQLLTWLLDMCVFGQVFECFRNPDMPDT